jgi:hypothetical protein
MRIQNKQFLFPKISSKKETFETTPRQDDCYPAS